MWVGFMCVLVSHDDKSMRHGWQIILFQLRAVQRLLARNTTSLREREQSELQTGFRLQRLRSGIKARRSPPEGAWVKKPSVISFLEALVPKILGPQNPLRR